MDVLRISRGCMDGIVRSDGTTGTQTKLREDKDIPGSAKDNPKDPGGGIDGCDVIEVKPVVKSMSNEMGTLCMRMQTQMLMQRVLGCIKTLREQEGVQV